jgi:hypothetical protein
MKPIFLTILALGGFLSLQAQNTSRNDSLLNREMTLEREYSPTVRDAVKLGQLPELREPQAPKTNVEFSNYATPYDVQSKLFHLSPHPYLTNLNYSKHKGYLTGGISSFIDINGDIGYQILNTDKDRLNLFFSHRSSNCDISYLQDILVEDETYKFKINDNWGGLNYLHDFGDVKLSADAKYTYSAFNYYGLSVPLYNYSATEPEPNTVFDKNTNQINGLFETHFGLSSDKADQLNYKFNIGYTYFQQKYGHKIDEGGSKENRILIDGNINQMVNSTTRLGLSASIKTYSCSDTVFRANNDSLTNYWTYSLNPYAYFEDGNWNLLLGVNLTAEVSGRKKNIVTPAIRFNYYPSNRFMFYLLAGGGRKDNSQYNLFYENRYIDPSIRVMDSRSPLDATAGVKFTPLSTMSVGIFGGYKMIKDEHFFVPNYGPNVPTNSSLPVLAGNWITPVYRDANIIKLGADFNYAYQNIFELGIKGTYYQWTIHRDNYLDDGILREAWNKPNFEANVNAAYRLPMVPLRFDLSYLGAYGRKTLENPDSSGIFKMKDIHDLNLKGTYSFTNNFSAYLSLNNLLFSKYDLWYGYPAQGFNIMGGLSVLF